MHASVLKMLRKFRAKWVKFSGRDTVLPVPAWVVKSMDSQQVFQFAGYLLEDARCLRTEDRRLRTQCYVRYVLARLPAFSGWPLLHLLRPIAQQNRVGIHELAGAR
jgi:hypothetical protein